MEIAQPLILVGTGRSGSTLLHELLSKHPNLAWISGLANFSPESGVGRALMRMVDVPLARTLVPARVRPSEHYGFWEHYVKGFTAPCRDLVAGDVTPRHKRDLHRALATVLTDRRSRLVLKVTGWPRVGFLREVFPDAKFVHLVRDGRAVASSLVQMGFWHGWKGPSGWTFGPLSAEQDSLWESHQRSFHALAGIEWNLLMDAMQKASAPLPPGQFLTLRYEDLCADKIGSMRQLAEFACLPWTPEFARGIERKDVSEANDKWKRDLTEEQQRIISEVTAPWLGRYGYL